MSNGDNYSAPYKGVGGTEVSCDSYQSPNDHGHNWSRRFLTRERTSVDKPTADYQDCSLIEAEKRWQHETSFYGEDSENSSSTHYETSVESEQCGSHQLKCPFTDVQVNREIGDQTFQDPQSSSSSNIPNSVGQTLQRYRGGSISIRCIC